MTFSVLTADTAAATWERARRRALVSGSPGAGKTTSLMTWPQDMAYMAYPGEKGTTSLRISDGIKAWVPDAIDALAPTNWGQIVSSIERTTNEILTGKAGKFRTFAGDGLHRLYTCYLSESTGGASARGEDFEAKLYSKASTRFFAYLDRVLRSQMEYVVFTCYDGLERDNTEDKSSNATQHVFPELPGKAAKLVLGEFAIALHATKQGANHVWQTRPQGRVWGASMKIPRDVAERIPVFVPQDWSKLEPLLAEKLPKT